MTMMKTGVHESQKRTLTELGCTFETAKNIMSKKGSRCTCAPKAPASADFLDTNTQTKLCGNYCKYLNSK